MFPLRRSVSPPPPHPSLPFCATVKKNQQNGRFFNRLTLMAHEHYTRAHDWSCVSPSPPASPGPLVLRDLLKNKKNKMFCSRLALVIRISDPGAPDCRSGMKMKPSPISLSIKMSMDQFHFQFPTFNALAASAAGRSRGPPPRTTHPHKKNMLLPTYAQRRGLYVIKSINGFAPCADWPVSRGGPTGLT